MSSHIPSGNNFSEADELALRTIVQKIRADLLAKGFEVDGGCVELSLELCKELCCQGYPAKTVQGIFRTDRKYDKWGAPQDACTAVHQWVEVNNLIVDATVEQFNDYLFEPVSTIVIGERSKLWRYEMPDS